MISISEGVEEDLKKFFDAHNGRLEIDFDSFKKIASEWKIYIIKKEQPVAVVIEKDGYAHIAAIDKQKVGMRAIKQAAKMLNVRKSTVENEYKKGHALSRRLGLGVEKIENGVTFYSMEYI